jgi:hypothetical protein
MMPMFQYSRRNIWIGTNNRHVVKNVIFITDYILIIQQIHATSEVSSHGFLYKLHSYIIKICFIGSLHIKQNYNE